MLIDDFKKNPFKVPDSYFDTLPMKVQDKCLQTNASRGFFASLKPRLAIAGGFGTAALVVAGLFSYFGSGGSIHGAGNSYDNAAYSGLSQETYPQTTNDFSYKFADNKKIDEDAIIKYLALENININDIVSARY